MNKPGYYILDGHVPRKVESLEEWAKKFGSVDRRVGDDMIGDVRVSTVFLGFDHAYLGGPPLLFETMIFGGSEDGYQDRCSTWEQAEAQHANAVAMVRMKSVN